MTGLTIKEVADQILKTTGWGLTTTQRRAAHWRDMRQLRKIYRDWCALFNNNPDMQRYLNK